MFDRKPESRLGDIGDPCTVVVRMAEGDEHKVTMWFGVAPCGGVFVDWVATIPIPVGGASLSASTVTLGLRNLSREDAVEACTVGIVARVSAERAKTGYMPASRVELRAEMLAAREELLLQNPEVTLAYELDPLLPQHLRQPYWEWQLENAYLKTVKEDGGSA